MPIVIRCGAAGTVDLKDSNESRYHEEVSVNIVDFQIVFLQPGTSTYHFVIIRTSRPLPPTWTSCRYGTFHFHVLDVERYLNFEVGGADHCRSSSWVP